MLCGFGLYIYLDSRCLIIGHQLNKLPEGLQVLLRAGSVQQTVSLPLEG